MIKFRCSGIIVKRIQVPLDSVLFIGNDINDIGLMEVVGYPLCPKDAYAQCEENSNFL